MTLRWRRDGEDFVLESSMPVLRHRGPRLGPSGVEAGLLRRRAWHWPAIAVVTWDLASGGHASLAVCLYGDPYTKSLTMNGSLWEVHPWDRVRVLLEPIRPLVEAMGARVEDRDEPATHWWYLDPDARRAQ
jgi:hypothetical protein